MDNKDLMVDLFNEQKELAKLFGDNFEGMSTDHKEEYTKDKFILLLSESHKILNEMNLKPWKGRKDVDKEILLDQLSDIMGFYSSICLCWGFTPKDIYDAYIKKNRKIYTKTQKRENGKKK